MEKAIPKKDIPQLINLLGKRYQVFVPQKKGEETAFAPATEESRLDLNYQTTTLPPKKFFLPPEEELFAASKGKTVEKSPPKPFVLFGVNKRDLEAIAYLDQIMSQKPADSFYVKRRKQAVLIALLEEPLASPPGGDLILEKRGTFYKTRALTRRGEKLLTLPLFQKKAFSDKKISAKSPEGLEALLLDSELVARAVDWSRENYPKIWEGLAKRCLACGICTYVCPLCYCFETEDKTSLDGEDCTRCRRWSACTLPNFALVAGGHNFRPTTKNRYFNWYYHKFVRAYREFGRAQCVACGRCQKYCPAGIDIEKVLESIVSAFRKAHPESKT
jgi:sulfhydrogenase subunit beta (sulfur reductase)